MTSPAFGMSPRPSVMRVSTIIDVGGGKRLFTVTAADVLDTKGPRGGPPGEHDVNREACPVYASC